MIPRDDQIALAVQSYHVLREHMIVYLAAEERVGKSLTAILTAEMCQNVERILVITKKEPLRGWLELFAQYNSFKQFSGSTYHSIHKLNPANYDLIILDESHNYISSYPKPNTIHKKVMRMTRGKPLIYISATPHPQGYQQLYHQFALSTWSPWKKYKNFYEWFKTYGIASSVYIDGIERNEYTKTHEGLVIGTTEHLFVTRTRKESGFKFEPKDKVHYVDLTAETKSWYNTMIKNLVVDLTKDIRIICDTKAKLRYSLHMLEGGTAKGIRSYVTLPNTEKVDYILTNWGDVPSLVIYYNYKQEEVKLKQYFKHARVLQATSFAEGIELSQYETIVVYSHDFSTARHSQRRARQASMHRQTEIVVHYLLVKDAASEQAYETVANNKTNFIDSLFKRNEL